MWCQGVNSSRVAVVDSLQLVSTNATVDSSGNIIGTSLVANGSNGISVYNGSTKTASIMQTGGLTCSNISTTGTGISVGAGSGVNAATTQAGLLIATLLSMAHTNAALSFNATSGLS